jgi:acetyltransferase-like isoleucine patch superfamily enzyme
MKLFTRIWYKVLKEWWRLTIPFRLRAIGVEVGKGAVFFGMPIIRMAEGSRIVIHDRVVLCSDSRFTDLGVNHAVVLCTLRKGAEIVIGSDCGVSGGAICAAVKVELGCECLIGANVTISDTDFHSIKPAGRRFNGNHRDIAVSPVSIESNVFLGMNTIVLKGVHLGRNSVVGAGSVVVKDIPANVICAGCPAKILRKL